MGKMSDFDRWLTTDPENQPDPPDDELVLPDEPDPCEHCGWVGVHELGCVHNPHATITELNWPGPYEWQWSKRLDELVPFDEGSCDACGTFVGPGLTGTDPERGVWMDCWLVEREGTDQARVLCEDCVSIDVNGWDKFTDQQNRPGRVLDYDVDTEVVVWAVGPATVYSFEADFLLDILGSWEGM